MLKNTEILLESIGKQIVIDLQNNIRHKQVYKRNFKNRTVNASGRLADSAEVRISDNKMEILINDYIYNLEYGVPPGRSTATVSDIIAWAAVKPVELRGNPYAAANTIIKSMKLKGTIIYQDYKGASTGIVGDIINAASIEEILKELSLSIFDSIEIEKALELK